MERRRRIAVLAYLAAGVIFLALAIWPAYRGTMLTLGVVFLVLALVQWKQKPRKSRR
jgi:uncharacterized membrane protein YqjE